MRGARRREKEMEGFGSGEELEEEEEAERGRRKSSIPILQYKAIRLGWGKVEWEGDGVSRRRKEEVEGGDV